MANLEFRYGAMNSGKSIFLLKMAHNYDEKKKKILIIKPGIDTKGNDFLVSRIGLKRQADIILAENEKLLQKRYADKIRCADCILIDEVHFLTPKQIEELWAISKILDIPVIGFGLRNDFLTNSFPGSKRLMELCDEMKELETLCDCGEKAHFNARKINGKFVRTGEQNLIDGSDTRVEYTALCGKCYLKLVKKITDQKIIKDLEKDS